MKQIVFVTGNQGKWKVANDIFVEYGLELLQNKTEIPEIQSLDVVEVAKFSAEFAAQKLQTAVMVSDVGYYFNALNGFPGPFVKYLNHVLCPDDILRLMSGQVDRSVVLRECLAYAVPNGKIITLVSEQQATLAFAPQGTGSTMDQLLILDGFDKPKGVYSDEEIFEHWKRTLDAYHRLAVKIKE